jgi:hypothetical protein
LLYQVVFTPKDPYILGIGFAAFRDVGSFFKYESEDDFGTPNPVLTKSSGPSFAVFRSRATYWPAPQLLNQTAI